MKAKLIKNHYGYTYFLADENGDGIATSDNGKLSKQNCNEIFGVVDVEKLCKQEAEKLHDKSKHEDWDVYNCLVYEDTEMIKIGFNKAMELNKDKVFTVDDVRNAMDWIMTQYFEFHEQPTTGRREQYLESLQQPNEIEVEILMRNSRTGNIVKHDSDLEWDEDGLCDRAIPKLDSSGCLILKKI